MKTPTISLGRKLKTQVFFHEAGNKYTSFFSFLRRPSWGNRSACLVSWQWTSRLPRGPCGSWATSSSESTTLCLTGMQTEWGLPLPSKPAIDLIFLGFFFFFGKYITYSSAPNLNVNVKPRKDDIKWHHQGFDFAQSETFNDYALDWLAEPNLLCNCDSEQRGRLNSQTPPHFHARTVTMTVGTLI